jgi:hypothetical protein
LKTENDETKIQSKSSEAKIDMPDKLINFRDISERNEDILDEHFKTYKKHKTTDENLKESFMVLKANCILKQ